MARVRFRDMRIEIHGTELPGRRWGPCENVHVGVQRRREVIDLHAADEPEVRWVFDVDLRHENGEFDVRGPYVHGGPGSRFLYLSWGVVDQGSFTMFRRAKLLFRDIEPTMLEQAGREPAVSLIARLAMTENDGGPRCGSVRPPAIEWALQRCS